MYLKTKLLLYSNKTHTRLHIHPLGPQSITKPEPSQPPSAVTSRAFHSHLSIRCGSCRGWVVYQGQVKYKPGTLRQMPPAKDEKVNETQSVLSQGDENGRLVGTGWAARHCFLLSLKMFVSDGPKMGSFPCPAWTFKFPCCLRPQNTTVATTPRNELSVRCYVAHPSAWLSSSSCELCLLPVSFSILQNLC